MARRLFNVGLPVDKHGITITYISVDLAHHAIFRANAGKGGINSVIGALRCLKFHIYKSDISLNIGQLIKAIKDHNYILHSLKLDPVFLKRNKLNDVLMKRNIYFV